MQEIVVLVACFLFACRTSIAQSDSSKERTDEAIKDLQKVAQTTKDRLSEQARVRNRLDRHVDCFIVKNCPLYYVVYGIRNLGIGICHEAAAGNHEWYIDQEGVAAFATDKVVSLDLSGATVREILDRVCQVDQRYTWTHDAKRGLVVLAPKRESRLQFVIGPIKDSGNPTELLRRLDVRSSAPPLANMLILGDNNLPDIVVDVPRCSATELLNHIVAQHPGMTWGFGGRVSFSYTPNTTAEAVRIEFPPVSKGTPVNGDWRYKVVERRIDGVSTLTLEKRRLAKPLDLVQPSRPLRSAAPTPVAQQDDVRTQEQNVVASRLAGSWKIDTVLTERLTGRTTTAMETLVVVPDPEVQKKIPDRFKEAVKKEGLDLEIRMSGYIEIRGAKLPFILTTIHGNPHLFYFRERGGDSFGDSESFNLMLAPAKETKNDLLFVGGDFNNQPFRAYSRVATEKN
jgi:hypothetical protein